LKFGDSVVTCGMFDFLTKIFAPTPPTTIVHYNAPITSIVSKEDTLADKVYKRVIADLEKYPSPEWEREGGDLYKHPNVKYKLMRYHSKMMQPIDVPFDLLGQKQQEDIADLWREQYMEHTADIEEQKFNKFLKENDIA